MASSKPATMTYEMTHNALAVPPWLTFGRANSNVETAKQEAADPG